MKNSIWRWIRFAGSGAIAVPFLTGCFDTHDEFTLNPNGSGKVVHESSFQPDLFAKEDSDDGLKNEIAKFIDKAKGVEAWRDVSYKWNDDGTIYFKGTAYFQNLNQLNFPGQSFMSFDWKSTATGGVLSWSTNRNRDTKEHFQWERKKVDWSSLSPEQQTKALNVERARFRRWKPLLMALFGPLKHSVSYRLPGKVAELSGFGTEGDLLKLELKGEKVFAAMEKFLSDDKFIKENANNFDVDQTAINEMAALEVFGSKGPFRATVGKATKALFDYDAEVADAKKALPKLLNEIGAAPLSQPLPAQAGELKSLKVIGVDFVGENPLRQEFARNPSYTLTLLGELPGSVLSLTEDCALESAIADDGSNLLPSRASSRRLTSRSLSKDKTAVTFDAHLLPPGPKVRGLKLLTGYFEYTTAANYQEVDLGFTEIGTGATGSVYNAKIDSITGSYDAKEINLKLRISPDSVKKLYILDGGQRFPLDSRGRWGGLANNWTFMLSTRYPLLGKGRIVAETYDQVRTVRVPFKLENFSVLGAPMTAQK